MVKDIVEINARNAHADAIERHAFKYSRADILTQIDATYLIVTPRTAIVYVSTNLCAVDAKVYLLLQVLIINILQSERITQEYPAPAEIGTYFDVGLRRQPYGLSVRTAGPEMIVVIGMCCLHHD